MPLFSPPAMMIVLWGAIAQQYIKWNYMYLFMNMLKHGNDMLYLESDRERSIEPPPPIRRREWSCCETWPASWAALPNYYLSSIIVLFILRRRKCFFEESRPAAAAAATNNKAGKRRDLFPVPIRFLSPRAAYLWYLVQMHTRMGRSYRKAPDEQQQ